MKASVQYNDIIGTAAADIADHYFNSLQKYLEDTYPSFDGDRYSCRGCTAYIGERNKASVCFICLDRETDDFVRFTTATFWTPDQFFDLFKRFEVVIGKDIDEVDVNEANERKLMTDGEE